MIFAKRKRLLAVLLAGTMAVSLFATGCSKPAEEKPAEQPVSENQSQQEEPKAEEKSRVLTIGVESDMKTTDPQIENSGDTTSILYNVYSNLLKLDTDLTICNDLATSYKLTDDPCVWEVKIRKDAKFHNGDPVTVDDVKFSLERVSSDESTSEYYHWEIIDHVDIVDDETVNIVTKEPLSTMPNLLAKSGGEILPKKYYEEVGKEKFLESPIGSGPYKLVKYERDVQVVLEPFEDYYGEKNDDWDQVVFRVIPEVSTRVGELVTGGVDIVSRLIPAEWDRVNNNEGTAIINGPSTRVYQLGLKCNEPFPTSDVRVRQAIDYAIDDQLIVDQVLKGAGTVTLTRIPEGVTGYDPDLYGKYNYDPEKAKELLKEAGYENGFDLKITGPTGRYLMDKEVQQTMAAMLEEVGIHVTLELVDSTAYSNYFANMELIEDAFVSCYGLGFFDANYGMNGYTHGFTVGETNYNSKEYEDLFAKAQTNMNLDERIEQLKECQKLIQKDKPFVVMMQITSSYGCSDNIEFTPRLDEDWDLLNIHSK